MQHFEKSSGVSIGQNKEKKLLTKNQKEFNRLIKHIEKVRRDIQAYEELGIRLPQRSNVEMKPFLIQIAEQQAEMVRICDRAFQGTFFKKKELEKLVDLILNLSPSLISEYGYEDLKEIYDRYSEMGFDQEMEEAEAEGLVLMREMAKEMLGLEFEDDFDLNDPEKVMERLQEFKEQKMEEERLRAEKAKEKRAKRPKTAKQQAQEAKQQEEKEKITKSVREIYMDLVKTFHPDREPDEVEKARKTEILQRVTAAYEANDLMGLLQLQLEFERIGQEQLETIADERLQRYNKVLRQQAAELDIALRQLLDGIGGMAGIHPWSITSPKVVELKFERDLLSKRKLAKEIREEVPLLRDNKYLRTFLKTYTIQEEMDMDFDF